MIDEIINAVERVFCDHEWLRKRAPIPNTDLFHYYVECSKCHKKSDGIDVGGFKYGNQANGQAAIA